MVPRAGWNCITIDMQHGTADYSDLLTLLSVTLQIDTVPWIACYGNGLKLLNGSCTGVQSFSFRAGKAQRLQLQTYWLKDLPVHLPSTLLAK